MRGSPMEKIWRKNQIDACVQPFYVCTRAESCMGPLFHGALPLGRKMPLKLGGRHPHPPLEGLDEVALIGEAGREGDLHQWRLRSGELPAGELDPELAKVLTDRTTVLIAEAVTQAVGMNARCLGDLIEGQTLREPRVEQISHLTEPA